MENSWYYSEWQNARLKFILSKYPKEFFKGKRILELGACNAFFSAYFKSLGADVLAIEGREENIKKIKEQYSELNVEQSNLDTSEWSWGKWDIIINFGLYYHLENFHKEHLNNCINNCDLMFFESVIYDSDESEIFFRQEEGYDQSLTSLGGTPSTLYVENIFKNSNKYYEIFKNKELNGEFHHYDWQDANTKKLDAFARRFWIVK
jgi:2-polyprenyl-3-methyl-5-hydroxy-6-metoxy-1,4-benzoquinol methylase